MGDEELVAIADAARQINRSREWLRRRVVRGEVRHQKIGKVVGIPETEVARLKRELADKPKPRGHWPKGKPRKPTPPVSDFRYPIASDIATHHLAAEH